MANREYIESENDGNSKKLKMKEVEELQDDQSLITTLPSDQIEEILSRVAASSSLQLAKCKMSCKAFNDISNAKRVLKSANCEDFYELVGTRNEDAMKFLRVCIANGNPTALFEKALLVCGTGWNLKKGIQLLAKASEAGHDTTTYLYGMMIACRLGSKHERLIGVNVIQRLKASIGKKIISCRLKLEMLVGQRDQYLRLRACNEYRPIKMRTDHHTDKCKDLFQFHTSAMYCSNYHPEVIHMDIDNEFCESCIWELESRFFAHLYGYTSRNNM